MEKFDLIELLTTRRGEGVFVWICNIGAEKYWNTVNAGVIDRNEDIIVNRVEEMNLLICREQDIIILRQMPDNEYLNRLKGYGFSISRILVPSNADGLTPISELVLRDEQLLDELKGLSAANDDVYFVPYAVTYLEEEIAEKCGLNIVGAPSKVNARINDKIFNREIAEKLDLAVCKGKVCSTVDEIREEFIKLTRSEPFFEKVIIKEPYGASGKGLYIIDNEIKLESILKLLNRYAKRNPDAKWLIEGWYQKKADLNYQIYVSPEGNVTVFSIKQQLLRDTVYIGSKVPPDEPEDVTGSYKTYGEKIGKYLYSIGYTGVAGIDSIITGDNLIIPIIEINGRFTLSTYISFVQRILGEIKMITRYFRLLTEKAFDYESICSLLAEQGILYDKDRQEGVIVYTSGTLPDKIILDSGARLGRMFTLVISKSWDRVEHYNQKLENLIAEISWNTNS